MKILDRLTGATLFDVDDDAKSVKDAVELAELKSLRADIKAGKEIPFVKGFWDSLAGRLHIAEAKMNAFKNERRRLR